MVPMLGRGCKRGWGKKRGDMEQLYQLRAAQDRDLAFVLRTHHN